MAKEQKLLQNLVASISKQSPTKEETKNNDTPKEDTTKATQIGVPLRSIDEIMRDNQKAN